MSITYTHPPHPAQLRQPAPGALSISLTAAPADRDPHDLPSFGSSSLTNPQAPVLYLPPLLSSLPNRYLPEPINSEHPPLVTETRLPDIDPASLSLHKALHHFKPVDADYVNKPYSEAFNWSSLTLPEDEEREWYCVVFRSKRKAGSDGGGYHLRAFRFIQSADATYYFSAVRCRQTGARRGRMNLATCIWQSRKHAIAANSRPHHIKAMRLAANSYEVYSLERHVLRKGKGFSGISVEPYISGDVGW
ncbi:hypothetical protein H0H81_002557 [Sphagnurus paluster]|uniref:Uncharacterized protein n=1 Tax=Sphagnurus paluster TaxID=117069 RepID=A0A9P7KLS4_9AGAR|nr:hypothetical protein H0H81_002557 [Sphagnurus paluster]